MFGISDSDVKTITSYFFVLVHRSELWWISDVLNFMPTFETWEGGQEKRLYILLYLESSLPRNPGDCHPFVHHFHLFGGNYVI